MRLSNLKIGGTAVVEKIGGGGSLRQHFLDMGVIPGAEITLEKFAPMGDPMEFRIHSYELTLRVADAEKILVKPVNGKSERKHGNCISALKKEKYPKFGEDGVYHDRSEGKPLPKGTRLTFALAGNQNCGKTTLFNQLTGSNQHVGNFPGVTVDRKSGAIKGYENTEVTDLPGIYSLSPYTSEEMVSRKFILDEKPKGIINIVDATNIERNLYLTMQLMELDIPMVLALNMMDEVRSNGGTVLINDMERLLGIPAVPISASKNEGVYELIRRAVHTAEYAQKPHQSDFCRNDGRTGAVHRAIHSIMHLIEDHAVRAEIPLRFAAGKLIEGDKRIKESLKLDSDKSKAVEHIIIQMEEERGLDRAAAMADMRFSFITELCDKTVVKPSESKEHIRSRKIDKILTGKYTAIPSFILIMALVFFLTFNVIGSSLQNLLQLGINSLTDAVNNILIASNVNGILRSLIIDGVFTGVGSVVSFVPIIVVLFFFLSLLEDSGYMARVAFVTDKLLRKIGLSGRSIVPMLIGFGCTVPGVMASRTLPSQRDRRMTVILTPFMSCTAKLTIYGFFIRNFFPRYSGLIMISIYLLGITVGILVALISKNTVFKGEAVPFVMELPNYRMPGAKNVLMLLWDKAKDFLNRAFTVIFLASIVVWFLQTFDFGLNAVKDSKDSTLALLAGFIAPVFAPIGLNDWRIVTALIAGFMAKESVVSTLEVLTAGVGITAIMPVSSAISMLVFCLLYTPCIAAVAAIRRELGKKWAALIIAGQCILAWICALLARTVCIIFNIL